MTAIIGGIEYGSHYQVHHNKVKKSHAEVNTYD